MLETDVSSNNELFNEALTILKEINRICRKNDIKYTVAYGTLIGTIRHKGFIPWDDDIDLWMLRSEYEKFKQAVKIDLSDDFFYQDCNTDKFYDRFPCRVRKNNTTYLCDYDRTFINKIGVKRHMGFFVSIFPVDNYVGTEQKFLKQRKLFRLRLNLLQSQCLRNSWKSKIASLYCNIVGRKNIYNRMHKSLKRVALGPDRKVFVADFFNRRAKGSRTYDYDDIANPIEMQFEDMNVYVMRNYDYYLTRQYGDYMTPPPIEKRIPMHATLYDTKIDYKEYISKNRNRI